MPRNPLVLNSFRFMIQLKCPRCEAAFKVPPDAAGREAKCPSCAAEFLLPVGLSEGPSVGAMPVASDAVAEPVGRGGGWTFLLALVFVAAAAAGMWWVREAALAPTTEGFQPVESIWAQFVGRFHPLVVHLPIGVVLLALMIESLRLLTRRAEWLVPAMTMVLWVSALSCLAAIGVGYLLVLDGGPGVNLRLLEQHIQFGLLFGGAVLASLVVWHLYRWVNIGVMRWGFRVVLVATVVLMSVGSHYGGALVHGPNYLTRHLPPELRPLALALGIIDDEQDNGRRDRLTAADSEADPGASDEAPAVPQPQPDEEETAGDPVIVELDDPDQAGTDPGSGVVDEPREAGAGDEAGSGIMNDADTMVMVYKDLVEPVFDLKCMDCHEEGNAKGRLRMDTYADLMKGGSLGESVIPGDAVGSELVFRLGLPMDDDERMPPPNEEQLTDAEVELVKWWIEQGAGEDLQVPLNQLPDAVRPLATGASTTVSADL